MHQETRKLTKKELDELRGVVAISTQVLRAVLFAIAVGVVGLVFRALFAVIGIAAPAWAVPTAIVGYLLYRRAERWTGGAAFRKRVRQDIEQGEARLSVINPADVTEFEELEDEGPAYVIRTDENEWLLLSGQELVPHKRRGFPWSQFSIAEAPNSGVFFGLERMGDPIAVDRTLPSMSYELARDLGTFKRTFIVLDDTARELLKSLIEAETKAE